MKKPVKLGWLKSRTGLRGPCDGGGCQAWVLKGEWYWREGEFFRLCKHCASGSTVTTNGHSRVIPPPPEG